MSEFLPKDYKMPSSGTGRYISSFPQGDTVVRVLGSAITGFEAWKDNKPHRFKSLDEIDPTDNWDNDRVSHFWAFVVWDYDSGSLKIMSITQKGIQASIKTLTDDEAWGHPSGYDLTINRQGEGLETKYTVTPKPPSEAPEAALRAFEDETIDLGALYKGDDPFVKGPNGLSGEEEKKAEESISADDISF